QPPPASYPLSLHDALPISMNGVHDMGGMHGLGPVEREPNEPVFHHDWERKVFALNLATGFIGKWNIDMGRYARELMPGPEYLTRSEEHTSELQSRFELVCR